MAYRENFTSSIVSWLEYAWDKRDKRVDNWPLMNSPLPTILLVASYILITTKFGKIFMNKSEPLKIRKIVMFYNMCMIAFNGFLVHQIWVLAWGNNYSWTCEPLDRSLSSKSLKIANLCWLYYILKFLDWFDSLFFILRKKFGHLSSLHVYHHSVMPCLAWLATRLMPGGHLTFYGLLNCFVHVIMHFYYFVAAMGPQFQKYLWWKKYLTTLQMLQFIVGILHGIMGVFIFECGIDLPKEWAYPFFPQPVILFYLFYNFYSKSYNKKSTSNGHAGKVNHKLL